MKPFPLWPIALLGLCTAAYADDTICVTLGPGGVAGNAEAGDLRASADGSIVAFTSKATNLLPGTFNSGHVFVRDLSAGSLELVSISTSGAKGNGPSTCGGLSRDGRFVAFESLATNLAPGDLLGLSDVFLRDRVLGTTTRVSVGVGGAEPDAACVRASVSDDGRYVYFYSNATNLIATPYPAGQGWIRDLQTGQTTLATADGQGTPVGAYQYGSLSGDGRYVAFATPSAVLPGFPGYSGQVYRRDLLTGAVDIASITFTGTSATSICERPSLSRDGRYVVFLSDSYELIAGDADTNDDVFLRDMLLGKTERISTRPDGGEPQMPSNTVAQGRCISGDGRFVCFESRALDIVPGLSGNKLRIFLRDRVAGTTRLVGTTAAGSDPNGICTDATLSDDGLRVCFRSKATNLAGPDSNAADDGFMRIMDSQAWHDLGFALAGVNGPPLLAGTGSLSTGTPAGFQLQAAAPSSLAVLFVALAGNPTPVKGGVLVPVPAALEVALLTDATGKLSVGFIMPAGLPAWTTLHLQAAIPDAAAPKGVAFSNALLGVVP